LIALAVVGFFALTAGYVLMPVLRPPGFLEAEAVAETASPRAAGRLMSLARKQASRLYKVAGYLGMPVRSLVETLQIISSFKNNLHLAWPSLFSNTMARLKVVNFAFLSLPGSACTTPNPSLYDSLMGISSGTAGLLLYLAIMWGVGLIILRRSGAATAKLPIIFNRQMVALLVKVLQFSYAPIVEIVLALFNCRKIGNNYYLREQPSFQCYTPSYYAMRGEATVWLILFVIGNPVLYFALLYYYGVPKVARELMRNSVLRSLVEQAHFNRTLAAQTLSVHNLNVTEALLTDDDIDKLHAAYFPETAGSYSGKRNPHEVNINPHVVSECNSRLSHVLQEAGAEAAGQSLPDSTSSFGLTALAHHLFSHHVSAREAKVGQLLAYARAHFHVPPVVWPDSVLYGDSRIRGAKQAVGALCR